MSFRFVKITLEDGLPSLDGEGHAAFGLAVPDEHGDESGIAANWLWDGERLEVTSDRHGYMPLYYHFEDATGTLRVSDSPLELLADGVSADLDVDSLGFFCRAGFLLGDRSLYRNIQRVSGGQHPELVRRQDRRAFRGKSFPTREPQLDRRSPRGMDRSFPNRDQQTTTLGDRLCDATEWWSRFANDPDGAALARARAGGGGLLRTRAQG